MHRRPRTAIAAPLLLREVLNATDRTSGPVICSYVTGWGSQGRESEETIVDRSTDLASRCFSFSITWCRSLLLSFSTCYLVILGLEGLKVAYWLEPPTKGQPPKRGQKLCSESVLYSEVPLQAWKATITNLDKSTITQESVFDTTATRTQNCLRMPQNSSSKLKFFKGRHVPRPP